MNPILSDILHIIAYTTLVLFGHRIFLGFYKIFYVHLFSKPKNLKKLSGGANWAIITGSSDGLGKAYANELAKNGFNLVLISRTLSKLKNVKNEINEKYSEIQVKIIAFDFGKSLFKDYEKDIFPILDKLDIGILVNNVGQMHKYPDYFHLFLGGPEKVAELVTVNTLPCTILTSKILSKMVERKSGIIINISSASGYHEMAKWSIYSGTKRFIKHFSACLHKEYSSLGITIQAICPMFLATNMTHYSVTKTILSPEALAESAIKTLGHTSETAGSIIHELQSIGLSFPSFFVDPFISILSKTQKQEILEQQN
uniref:Uncharacterized protein n=1 Tax=Panagrolaimus sp. PS1159 TaxID=55785 RepID=A0AC35GSF8_9BILA